METLSGSYHYETLDASRHDIRLIRLLPGTIGELIECQVEIASLDDNPIFEALSYEWGDPNIFQPNIKLNDTFVPVRNNLFWALHHLRDEENVRTFWIDAVCIDQQNLTERNHQVAQMNMVYSQAANVVAWIGREGNTQGDCSFDETRVAVRFIELVHSGTIEDYPYIQHAAKWDAVRKFMSRNYWSRLWTIQEVLLAPKVMIQCGQWTLEWNVFSYFCHQLPKFSRPSSTDMDDWNSKFHLRQLEKMFSFKLAQNRAKTIDPLRQTRSYYPPLVEILSAFKDSECYDPRDRVFGILSLCQTCCRDAVPADYSMELASICAKVIEHEATYHSSGDGKQTISIVENVLYALRMVFSRKSKKDYVRRSKLSLEPIGTEINVPVMATKMGRLICIMSPKHSAHWRQTSIPNLDSDPTSNILEQEFNQSAQCPFTIRSMLCHRGIYLHFNPTSSSRCSMALDTRHQLRDVSSAPNIDISAGSRISFRTKTMGLEVPESMRYLQAYMEELFAKSEHILAELGLCFFLSDTGMIGCVTNHAINGDEIWKLDGSNGKLAVMSADGCVAKGLELTPDRYPEDIRPYPSGLMVEPVKADFNMRTLLYLLTCF